MQEALELAGSLLSFAARLRLWTDVVAADAVVGKSQSGCEARKELSRLAGAVSATAHGLVGMPVVDRLLTNEVASYADTAERIAVKLPDGPHRNAVREMAKAFRADMERQLRLPVAYR